MSKPQCHECIHHRTIPGNAHIECRHPTISEIDRLMTPLLLMQGHQNAPAMKRMNVMGDAGGIRRGYFAWPLNFDPTWLLTCDRFEGKEVEKHESKATQ